MPVLCRHDDVPAVTSSYSASASLPPAGLTSAGFLPDRGFAGLFGSRPVPPVAASTSSSTVTGRSPTPAPVTSINLQARVEQTVRTVLANTRQGEWPQHWVFLPCLIPFLLH